MRLTSGGAWPGNDTLWRSILDLVEVITFCDHDGRLMNFPQRSHLCVVDGIIGGEGDGPLTPCAKNIGCIIASSDPVSADWTACRVIGFDWERIPQLYNAKRLRDRWDFFPSDPGSLTFNWANSGTGVSRISDLPVVCLKPPTGWIGHVEIAQALTRGMSLLSKTEQT
jgi:hypothetical protein